MIIQARVAVVAAALVYPLPGWVYVAIAWTVLGLLVAICGLFALSACVLSGRISREEERFERTLAPPPGEAGTPAEPGLVLSPHDGAVGPPVTGL